MTAPDHRQVSEIFASVCDAPAERRRALLDNACGGDDVLRQSVESLLRYHDQPAGLLDSSIVDIHLSEAVLTDLSAIAKPALNGMKLPDRIGRYRIIRQLGEGGMGIVYLAEQDRPRRTVALKLLRFAHSSPDLLRRFELEEQTLARLHHPGIAQIYEAGVADDGRPFFAMEFVAGRPLTDFVREHALGIHERLRLITLICDAVQHAHQRGIIHRDLKPGNVLVSKGTSTSETHISIKVVDFGVARAMAADARAHTLHTSAGQLLGTLAYMSPEQLSGDHDSVDVRSDVYALGVMLFEVLAGRQPHDLRRASLHESARIICEHDPPRLGSLNRAFRGDIETIVGKALERDVQRRYQSASQLAEDIRLHLDGAPILARQNSAMYVLRKQLRRYRWAASATLVFLALLIAFSVYAAVQARTQQELATQEREARKLADDATAVAETARTEELRQRQAADASASRAQAVSRFLIGTLGLTDLDITPEIGMSVDVLLDRAAADIATAFADDPRGEAAVRTVIGRAYASHGKLEQADAHLHRALRLQRRVAPQDLEALYEILWPYWRVLTDLDDAMIDLHRREAYQVGQQIITNAQPELGQAVTAFMSHVGATTFERAVADQQLAQVLKLAHARIEPDDPLWLYVGDQIQMAGYVLANRSTEASSQYLFAALDIFRTQLPETNTRIVRTLDMLVSARLIAEDYDGAAALIDHSSSLLAKLLPGNHWYVAQHQVRLAECRIGQGRLPEAEALLNTNLPHVEAGRGRANRYTIAAHRVSVQLHDAWNQPQRAREHRMAMAQGIAAGVRGATMNDLMVILEPQHQPLTDALERIRQITWSDQVGLEPAVNIAFSLWQSSFIDDHVVSACIADAMHVWAMRHRQGRGPELLTQRMHERVTAVDRAAPHRHARKRADNFTWMAIGLTRLGEFTKAEPLYLEAIDALESSSTERYAYSGAIAGMLGGCLLQLDRFEEAEQWMIRGYNELLSCWGPYEINVLISANRLADAYIREGRIHDAEPYAVAALDIALTGKFGQEWIDNTAWMIAKVPGFSRQAYEAALVNAQRAVELRPEHSPWVNTLGAALYRLERYEEALIELMRADELRRGRNLADAALLALTHWQLGNREQARAELARARELRDSNPKPYPASVVLTAEAERVIGDN